MSLDTLEPIDLGSDDNADLVAADGGVVGQSLASGVAILLAITVVQRLVGFVRSMLFCRWLDADQLGLWDMAFGFLVLAAPLCVLSLPGVFGRYVEYFRRRGHLHALLRETAVTCLVLAGTAIGLLCLAPQWFAAWIFNDAGQAGLIVLCAASLVAFITYNYLGNLFTAVCNMRLVAVLDLLNSLVFAGVGLGLIYFYQPSAASVVIAYGAACLVCVLAAVWPLSRVWAGAPTAAIPIDRQDLWSKIAPMAVWIVVLNLTTNLFAIADRYVMVYFAPGSTDEVRSLVGQYCSSRLIPTLLVSLAALLATMMLPHLSRDWEAGRRDLVAARLNLFLKVFGLCFLAAAVGILAVAPWMFHAAFANKYAAGLEVLPGTLVFSIWFGITLVAQQYLWCAERARLVSLALAVGLATNVACNILLLPSLGLWGTVLAASLANLVTMLLVLAMSRRHGLPVDAGLWPLLAAPLALMLGWWAAAMLLAAILLTSLLTDHIFHGDEKRQLAAHLADYRAKAAALLGRWS